jgi:uncharacterized protein YigE (DUF2233 family)
MLNNKITLSIPVIKHLGVIPIFLFFQVNNLFAQDIFKSKESVLEYSEGKYYRYEDIIFSFGKIEKYNTVGITVRKLGDGVNTIDSYNHFIECEIFPKSEYADISGEGMEMKGKFGFRMFRDKIIIGIGEVGEITALLYEMDTKSISKLTAKAPEPIKPAVATKDSVKVNNTVDNGMSVPSNVNITIEKIPETPQFAYKATNSEYYANSEFDPSAKENEFSSFKLKFSNKLGQNFIFARNHGNISPQLFLENFNQTLNKDINSVFYGRDGFFAITASMFDKNTNMPPGLLIEKGVVVSYKNLNEGEGNFYSPKPNGIFSINSKNVEIVTTSDFDLSGSYDFAIQSGPILISNGQINKNLSKISKNKHLRCGIGIVETEVEKYVVFVASKTEVSFFEFASYLKNTHKCKDAIHLESINAFVKYPLSDYKMDKQIIKNFIIIK